MTKILLTSLATLAAGIFKRLSQNQQPSLNTTRLKISLLYVKSIKTFRLLFLSLLGIGVFLIFLLIGLILFNMTLFLYTPWEPQVKMYVGFFSAMLYCVIAAILFYYVFLQNTWMTMFHADEMINELTGGMNVSAAEGEKKNEVGKNYSTGASHL